MLLKESKIKVLENFYGLDYIFFGRPVSEVTTCCPLVKEEYLSIKGALMSVFVEMLKLMEHTPSQNTRRVTSEMLMKHAKAAAQLSRNEAERVVSSPKSRDDIKATVRESMQHDENVDISGLVEAKIREKAFALAVDHMLISEALSDADNLDEMNGWEGEIVEDSYKILRDNLVEAAHDIIYNDDVLAEDMDYEDELEEAEDYLESLKQRIMEEENIEELSQGGAITIGAILGFLTPIPGGAVAGGITGWALHNRKLVNEYCERKTNNPKDFQKCRSLGAAAIKQKIAREKANRR